MGNKSGWAARFALGICCCCAAAAQTLTSQALNGKYFFRHISMATDVRGGITDPRSILGTLTFDGAGHYTFSGQQLKGPSVVTPLTGTGAYSVDPSGIVAMDNPQRSGVQINGRLGTEALIGTSTEASDNVFDLLVAIPAPSTAAPLIGPYWMASLEFPQGSGIAVRDSFFSITTTALGKIGDFQLYGHAANLSNGQPGSQIISGATYSMTNDGTGTAYFGPYSLSVLLSGNRTLYESADGNVLLGGSSSLHDILIGIKAPTAGSSNASWNGNFWSVGLRFNPTAQPPDISAFSGSLAARGQGIATLARRTKSLSGAYDFTGVNTYSLTSGGGIQQLLSLGVGSGGATALAASLSGQDPGAYEINLSVQMPSLSGPGAFLNPQGVTSAASFFPPGAPISPGEFVALFGTGLAPSAQTASPPYPASLNGVSVLINGAPAPIRSVSATQINCLVPYSTTGTTATIVVQNGNTNSNAVTAPLALTTPSVFTLNQSGTGAGAILHANYTPVSATSPATSGETVLVFLTGMGAVDPPVSDGAAGPAGTLNLTTASPLNVIVGGEKSTVVFSGLAPGYPGLYQLNVTLPPYFPASGLLPLAIQTRNAFHDQVDIAVK
jgi:uncharacterized protein (TIGR03437 family)